MFFRCFILTSKVSTLILGFSHQHRLSSTRLHRPEHTCAQPSAPSEAAQFITALSLYAIYTGDSLVPVSIVILHKVLGKQVGAHVNRQSHVQKPFIASTDRTKDASTFTGKDPFSNSVQGFPSSPICIENSIPNTETCRISGPRKTIQTSLFTSCVSSRHCELSGKKRHTETRWCSWSPLPRQRGFSSNNDRSVICCAATA